MAHHLPPIPKCSRCGNIIVGNGAGGLCRTCSMQDIQQNYAKMNEAEVKIARDKAKYLKFSEFSVVTFAVILFLLIVIVIAVLFT